MAGSLTMTLDELWDLVGLLRHAQKTYYKRRRHATGEEYHRLLQSALDLEAEVDRVLEEHRQRRLTPLFDRDDPTP